MTESTNFFDCLGQRVSVGDVLYANKGTTEPRVQVVGKCKNAIGDGCLVLAYVEQLPMSELATQQYLQRAGWAKKQNTVILSDETEFTPYEDVITIVKRENVHYVRERGVSDVTLTEEEVRHLIPALHAWMNDRVIVPTDVK